MIWQDIVIAGANLLFAYSLCFQVYLGFKNRKGYLSLQSTFLTTLGLYAMATAFFTLSLLLSAFIAALNGTLWLILFVQSVFYEKAR